MEKWEIQEGGDPHLPTLAGPGGPVHKTASVCRKAGEGNSQLQNIAESAGGAGCLTMRTALWAARPLRDQPASSSTKLPRMCSLRVCMLCDRA